MADPRFIGVLNLSSYAGLSPYGSSNGGPMIVNDDFSFIDRHSITWIAHKGEIVDGASIPPILKLIVGGSFRSSYLPAAVLHDVYCRNKTRTQAQTSEMFYEAMVTNEVNIVKALAMWSAVRIFGPHW